MSSGTRGPKTTAQPTMSTSAASGGCEGIPAWESDVAYTGGAVVTYDGHKWTAKWWNQNEVPGGASGVWIDNGACDACPNIAPWRPRATYVAGDLVTYRSHKWTAKWWNRGEVPGGASGAWTDNGPCGGCGDLAPWHSTSAYTAGDVVTYKGHKWTAKWWNQNEAPGGASGAWTDNGPC